MLPPRRLLRTGLKKEPDWLPKRCLTSEGSAMPLSLMSRGSKVPPSPDWRSSLYVSLKLLQAISPHGLMTWLWLFCR